MPLPCHKLCFWPLETILFMLLILLSATVLNSSRRLFEGTTELIVVEAPAADDVSVIVDYLLPLLFFPVVELELLTVIVMANPPFANVGDSLAIPDSVIVFYFFRGMSSKGPDHLRFDWSFYYFGGYRNLFISGQFFSWDLLSSVKELVEFMCLRNWVELVAAAAANYYVDIYWGGSLLLIVTGLALPLVRSSSMTICSCPTSFFVCFGEKKRVSYS